MTVSAISGYGQIQNIYAYHNTHYNQMQTVPVTPVQKTAGVSKISDEEDSLRLAATYRPAEDEITGIENTAVAKQTEKLKDFYEKGQELHYNRFNPYEAARMSVDGMLVAGMNIDLMA